MEGTCWDLVPVKIPPRFTQHPPLYVEMLVELYCFLTESCKIAATIRSVTQLGRASGYRYFQLFRATAFATRLVETMQTSESVSSF
jgi:hypothetical protein